MNVNLNLRVEFVLQNIIDVVGYIILYPSFCSFANHMFLTYHMEMNNFIKYKIYYKMINIMAGG